jgi:type IV secretory pathway VirB4 component
MPLTTAQHKKKLKVPAVCELLPLRDILDDVMVRTNGSFVAGYELRGTLSYFATDEDRNQAKSLIEALLRSIPDVSMRVQFRYEISEDLGTLLEDYVRTQSTTQSELMALDTHRLEMWQAREREGHYFGIRLHAYFIWDPRIHAKIYHSAEKKRRDGGIAFSQKKCIERARKEHETLLNEFESIMRGVSSVARSGQSGPAAAE